MGHDHSTRILIDEFDTESVESLKAKTFNYLNPRAPEWLSDTKKPPQWVDVILEKLDKHHSALNVDNCKIPLRTEVVVLVFIIGFALGYLYHLWKNIRPKPLRLHIPPYKYPFDLSFGTFENRNTSTENKINSIIIDAPNSTNHLYASPRNWVLINLHTRRVIAGPLPTSGEYVCLSRDGAKRFSRSEVVNVDEWVDAVEREFLYSGSNFESSSTPKGTASTGYSRKRTNTGAGDSTLPRSSRNHRAHVNVGRMPLRDSGGASTTGWTATDEDGILTPPGSSTVGEGFYF